MNNPASLFLPASDVDTSESFAVSQAIACIDWFTDAFNARDLAAMDACLHFPHIILSGERLVIWESAGQLPASFFDNSNEIRGGSERSILTSMRCWSVLEKSICSSNTQGTAQTVLSSRFTRTCG